MRLERDLQNKKQNERDLQNKRQNGRDWREKEKKNWNVKNKLNRIAKNGGGHREKRNPAVLGLLVRIHNTCTTAPRYDLRAGGCVSRAGKQRVEPYVELYHSYLSSCYDKRSSAPTALVGPCGR